MSLTLNGTDPLQLSDVYSRPASKVFPPIQNIRNPSKSSYPDNPLVQPNFRQQNHRIIRSCSLISASKIIARQPPFHQIKIKNAPSCSFTNSPARFSIQFLSIRNARQPSLHPGIPIPAPYFALLSQYMHRYTRFSRSVSLNT